MASSNENSFVLEVKQTGLARQVLKVETIKPSQSQEDLTKLVREQMDEIEKLKSQNNELKLQIRLLKLDAANNDSMNDDNKRIRELEAEIRSLKQELECKKDSHNTTDDVLNEYLDISLESCDDEIVPNTPRRRKIRRVKTNGRKRALRRCDEVSP